MHVEIRSVYKNIYFYKYNKQDPKIRLIHKNEESLMIVQQPEKG